MTLLHILLYFLNRSIKKGSYGRVLHACRVMVDSSNKLATYRNIMRLTALIRTKNEAWKSEVTWLVAKDKLRGLTKDERNYIILYLENETNGFLRQYCPKEMPDLGRVPKFVKEYFPVG